MIDAGGGTVDAVTYQVEKTSPLRLTEVTESEGQSKKILSDCD